MLQLLLLWQDSAIKIHYKLIKILLNFLLRWFSICTRSIRQCMNTKTTAAQNGVALSYRKVRGLYFLAVVFVRHIMLCVLGTCVNKDHIRILRFRELLQFIYHKTCLHA